jgi:hypothetical protein
VFRYLLLLLIAMPTDTFTSSGTWNRLAGVTKGTVEAGGPGGGSGGNSEGGGGGGGGWSSADITGLTAAGYSVTIGSPGSPGDSSGSTAGDGGDTYWDDGSLVLAHGGGGGQGGPFPGGAGGAGAAAGVGDVANTGGNGGNRGTSAGGGGGGGASGPGNGVAGSDGDSGVGGAGGSSVTPGGNGGDDNNGAADGQTAGTFLSGGGAGGCGGDSGNGPFNGGTGGPCGLAITYSLGTLDVPTQPSAVNSGSPIPTFTARIKDVDGSPDTNADTAGAGNTCTVTIETGSGTITGGTTSRAYGTGADGSKANFDDIVVTGSGSHTLRITDDVSGVYVVTSSFTVTAPTVTNTGGTLSLMGVG